jgi:hypothetical protein
MRVRRICASIRRLERPTRTGAPALGADQHRHGKVVDRLAPRLALLDEQGLGGGGGAIERRGERAAHQLGTPTVRCHLALGVQHHRVDHVGVPPHAIHVLLEGGEVVEEQRRRRDRREITHDDLAAPEHLADDGRALAVLDHRDHPRHHHQEDEDGAGEQAGLKGVETPAHPVEQGTRAHRRSSSQIFLNGMYGSPSPFTSTLRT